MRKSTIDNTPEEASKAYQEELNKITSKSKDSL